MKEAHHALSHRKFDMENYIGIRRPDDYHEELDERIAKELGDWNPFDIDIDIIMESKALRRAAFKTQFICSAGTSSHKRTRRSHIDEVDSGSRQKSKWLGLDSTLCDAIALGHDLGHTPYGHIGEYALEEITGKPFSHVINGLNIGQHIERKGKGLNLDFEVLWGILNHSTKFRKRMYGNLNLEKEPIQEVLVTMYEDKFKYVFGDFNDVSRSPSLKHLETSFPKELYSFGTDQRERDRTLNYWFMKECAEKGYVSFEDCEAAHVFKQLRKYLYENIHPIIKWDLHIKNIEYTYEALSKMRELKDCNIAILIGCMTDNDINRISQWAIEQNVITWNKLKEESFGICEIAPYIRSNIDQTDPDLNWGIVQMAKKYPNFAQPNMNFYKQSTAIGPSKKLK